MPAWVSKNGFSTSFLFFLFFSPRQWNFFYVLLLLEWVASSEPSWNSVSAQNSLPAEKKPVRSVPEDLALRCTDLLWALFCRNRQLGLRFYETCGPVGARVLQSENQRAGAMPSSAMQAARSLGNTVMFSFLAGFLFEKHKDSLPKMQWAHDLRPQSQATDDRNNENGNVYTRISLKMT